MSPSTYLLNQVWSAKLAKLKSLTKKMKKIFVTTICPVRLLEVPLIQLRKNSQKILVLET